MYVCPIFGVAENEKVLPVPPPPPGSLYRDSNSISSDSIRFYSIVRVVIYVRVYLSLHLCIYTCMYESVCLYLCVYMFFIKKPSFITVVALHDWVDWANFRGACAHCRSFSKWGAAGPGGGVREETANDAPRLQWGLGFTLS